MSNYPLPKDPMEAAYLQHLRDRNVKIASICHYCKKASSGINSDGYRILFVCDDHFEAGDDVILDTSMPGVLHYTYPNGKKLTKEQLDPNIGNFFPPRPEEEIADIWSNEGGAIKDSFWETQVSFEE